jgi:hypothetical protein
LFIACFFKAFALTGRQIGVHNYPGRCPGLGNFCPFRAYWVISTVQVDPFPSREGNLKRKGRETSREKSSGRLQGRNPQRNLKGDPKGEILRETLREKSSERPQGDLKGEIIRETSREKNPCWSRPKKMVRKKPTNK